MSLLTSRYALALGRCGKHFRNWWQNDWSRGESKRVSGGVYVRAGAARYFDSRANMEAMLVSLAIARGGVNGRQTFSQKRICSVSLRPVRQ